MKKHNATSEPNILFYIVYLNVEVSDYSFGTYFRSNCSDIASNRKYNWSAKKHGKNNNKWQIWD